MPAAAFVILERARNVRLLALDVDGILSDGLLCFSSTGEELKHFNVQDGLGIKLLQEVGIEVALITGRHGPIIAKRAQDLHIKHVFQGRDDKGVALLELCQTLNLSPADCAYMGDDWVDLSALKLVNFAISVPNAHAEVRSRVHLVTQAAGGAGAVREVCDIILQAQGHYTALLENFLALHKS